MWAERRRQAAYAVVDRVRPRGDVSVDCRVSVACSVAELPRAPRVQRCRDENARREGDVSILNIIRPSIDTCSRTLEPYLASCHAYMSIISLPGAFTLAPVLFLLLFLVRATCFDALHAREQPDLATVCIHCLRTRPCANYRRLHGIDALLPRGECKAPGQGAGATASPGEGGRAGQRGLQRAGFRVRKRGRAESARVLLRAGATMGLRTGPQEGAIHAYELTSYSDRESIKETAASPWC